MKKFIILIIFLTYSAISSPPSGKEFGFGIQVGEPTALTAKYWVSNTNAFQFSLGSGSYAGLRITGDYLWEFDAFNHSQFKLYAGPGIVIGFGKGNTVLIKQDDDKWFYRDNGTGIAGRGIVGINYMLSNTPIELFLETGILLGVTPSFGALSESALGIRFYF